jgi:hypothetical protein
MFRFRFIFIWFICHACSGLAQSGTTNPFELEHRVREALAELAAAGGQATPDAAALPLNPFDVAPHRVPLSAGIPKENEKKPTAGIILRPQPSTKKPFVLVFLVGAIGFLALTFAVRRAVAIKTWSAFFSNNFMIQAQRDYNGMIGSAPFYLLYVHFFVNIGLFGFLSLRAFTGDQFNSISSLLIFILGAGAFYLLKNVVVNLLGWLFDCQKEASQYNFLILVFCCVLGLFLLPANMFLALKGTSDSFLPFWVAAMILVFYLFRWARSIGLFGSFVAKNLFHILLYLCAVEILPIAVLVKLAISNLA